jgi:hypothetical protein
MEEEGEKLFKTCFGHLRNICLGRLVIALGLKS